MQVFSGTTVPLQLQRFRAVMAKAHLLRRELPGARWSLHAGEGMQSPPADRDWMDIAGPATAAAALQGANGSLSSLDSQGWWFRCRFDAPEGASILGFDGLATRTRVWLNGEHLLDSVSMFTRHRCDVEKLLRRRDNELLIAVLPLEAELKTRRARPAWRAPMVAHQQLRWWRTTLLGRTPGWSPPQPPVGPWRDVWIGPRESLALDMLQLRARIEGHDGVVEAGFEGVLPGPVNLRLARDGHTWSVPLEGRMGRAAAALRVPDVHRWWPHTHGEPALYQASLTLAGDAGPIEVPLAPVGFREITLDTDAGGFQLRVNGLPVFCRGAVWMPLDAARLRAAPAEYPRALEQVQEGGMNMLRVPGTTVYEEDAFYEACDRAGVLVWQDFMFANMDYPRGDESFDALVELEVRQQLQRLHAHPCLAILCGNSEAEQQAAMWGAPRAAWAQPLFSDLLPRLCERWAPGVAYWPSSAHGGALPQQPNAGSCSYYGVGAYLRPVDDARACALKFASECLAFANVPAPRTLGRMPGGASLRPHHPGWKERSPRDLGAGWDFDDVRDHYLEELYGVDALELRSTDAERYLALSRKVTGDAMAGAFAHWRARAAGCGGALVLMLRDLWAGAGWGLLDDEGWPKPCWHVLRRALQPVTVLVTDEGMNGLHAHVINESGQPHALQLEMRAWRDGEVLVAQVRRAVDLGAHDARAVALAKLLDHFMDLNWSHRFGPPPCDVVECRLFDGEGTVLARTHYVQARRFAAARDDVGLCARANRIGDAQWEVSLAAKRFAWGVHFDWAGMVAQDDWFDLVPGDEVRVLVSGTPERHASASVEALNSRMAVPIIGAGA
jgi:beta-mannosidase